jgi:hypothetical protein
MCLDPSLCEKSECLARLCALTSAENLHFCQLSDQVSALREIGNL